MACAKRAACETTRSKALRVVYEHLDLGRRLGEYKERLKRLRRFDVALNERNREHCTRRNSQQERGEPSQGRCPAKADEAALRDSGRENRRELAPRHRAGPGSVSGGERGEKEKKKKKKKKKKRGGQPQRAAPRSADIEIICS